MLHNGFELSGPLSTSIIHQVMRKIARLPGPLQRMVIRQAISKMLFILILTPQENNEILLWSINSELPI